MMEFCMHPPVSLPPPELVELLQLGQILGQNQSFAIVAGRCSAAQAETILRIREGRLYLRCAASWKEFCPQYLHISVTQADRIIRMWQQHGPALFELQRIANLKCKGEDRLRLELTLSCASAALQQIEIEHGLYPQEPHA